MRILSESLIVAILAALGAGVVIAWCEPEPCSQPSAACRP